MLSLTVRFPKGWVEEKQEFVELHKPVTIQLEHSLVSISKWEAIWQKPFLGESRHSPEEVMSYIKCMTITQNVDPMVYDYLSKGNIQRIAKYMDSPMTATWFSDRQKRAPSSEVVTSELIYYWMIAFNIPFQCEKWHLNRLLTLVRVCEAKAAKKEKMSKRDEAAQRHALNEARRAKHASRK